MNQRDHALSLLVARTLFLTGGAFGLLMAAERPAQADLTDLAFEIQATNASGTGIFQLNLGDLFYDAGTQSYYWDLLAPIDLIDDSTLEIVAIIDNLSMTYVADPQVSFGFSVQAGMTDTTFAISSGLLSFPAIDPAKGLASAGILITDTNEDGATLTGLHTGGGVYASQYNGLIPGGTTFAELITTPLTATVLGTNSANAEFPGGGLFAAIGVPVVDISAGFSFLLTAQDLASGSSNFSVIPAPGGLALILICGLGAKRRRRRN